MQNNFILKERGHEIFKMNMCVSEMSKMLQKVYCTSVVVCQGKSVRCVYDPHDSGFKLKAKLGPQ